MKKRFLLVIVAFFLILPLISAINLEIEEKTSDVAMILGLDMPAIFDLSITNFGESDYFMFYNFFGSDTLPKGTVLINSGEAKDVAVGVYPRDDLRQEGRIKFDIYIKSDSGQMTYPLMVNAVKLKDAFEVGAEEFEPDSNNVSVYIKNTVNFNFNNIKARFKSPFFDFEKTFSLSSYQKESFEISLDKEDFKDLMAGFYTLDVEVTAGEKKEDISGIIRFSEKDIVTSSQNEYGIIVYTKKITKINEGNTISDSSTVLKKNIFSRLFTTFSPEPDIVERKGLVVYYTWEKELKPGEQIEIVVKTNWLLPLLAILLVIAIVILTKQFSKTNLSLKKRVSFVRAKGGEFALKVSVIISARKYVERVNVIDRLPLLAKLHERFGGEMPKKVDEKNKRIEWYFEKLQAGETRMISYIIYSKVGVLGKFALPTTTAVYEKDGEVHEAESNQAFFIAEQGRKPIED
ncbi:MAG TPA: hypothetical protein VJ438_03100 [Candidatus Nanoarchaeia archaeon]|nr:hypothetical protein [Candidatus Nanoarchaeia archaeon]